MEIIAFLVAIGMYGVWRLWLAARGEDYKPEGKWTSRTDAMSEYMERTNPGSTQPPRGWRLIGTIAVLIYAIAIVIAVFVFMESRPDR